MFALSMQNQIKNSESGGNTNGIIFKKVKERLPLLFLDHVGNTIHCLAADVFNSQYLRTKKPEPLVLHGYGFLYTSGGGT